MPNGHNYVPLVDVAAAEESWKSDQKRWKIYLFQKYMKTGMKMGSKRAISSLVPLVGGLLEIPAIYSTQKHLSHLHELEEHYSCSCTGEFTCKDILSYVETQKSKKLQRRKVTATPIVGMYETARSKGKAIQKTLAKSKGKERETKAHALHLRSRNGCTLAMAIVAELVGNYRNQQSWEKAFAIREWKEGWKVIMDKMAST